MEPERAAEVKRVLPKLLIGLVAVESFALPIFRSGGRTELSFWQWVVNHTVFGPACEYVPVERYARELEGVFPWYPVKERVQTFRTMEEAMAYFKTDQLAVKEMLKNGAISIIASDSKLQQYDDLLADVRHDQKYHPIRSLVQPDDPEVRDIARVLVQAPDFIAAAQEFVNSFTTYRSEVGDYWGTPAETLAAQAGDCLPGETKIICIEDGRYVIKMLGDLQNQTGIQVLSYNFSEHRFEPKPVLRFIRKGVRPTVRVRLRNGADFRCTLDHRLYSYCSGWVPRLRERTLASHLTFRQTSYAKLVCAREIPAIGTLDIPDNQLWVEGIYAAEGNLSREYGKMGGHWFRTRIVNTKDSIKQEIISKLKDQEVGYSIGKFNVRVNRSPLKQVLVEMGDNSLERHFLPDRLSGNNHQLEVLLDGYTRGDGCLCAGRYQDYHRVRSYTTVSNELASQLRFLHLLLGRPLYYQPMPPYNGDGRDTRHPAYRLVENTASRFNKEIMPGLSKVSIRSVGEPKEEEVFDITVADNHNFLLADSFILAHNCDDKGILLCSILRNYIPAEKVYCAFGLWTLGGKTSGHLWVITDGENGEDRIVEATAGPDKPPKGKYVLHAMFNDEYAFATDIGLREFDLKPVEIAELALARR